MDLYFCNKESASQEIIEIIGTCNFLFSYADLRKVKTLNISNLNGKLFIDSGAYSMWTRGITIDIDEYIEWINQNNDYIDLYGQLDVIPESNTPIKVKKAAQNTWDNFLYMYSKMKKPEKMLYTFHVGEPIEFLKQALEWKDNNNNQLSYIALGGMVGKSTEVRKQFLNLCFDTIKNSSNPNVKTHTFGMTTEALLKEFPITSTDSTRWILTASNGKVLCDYGEYIISNKRANDPKHFSKFPLEVQKQFEEKICKYGFTLEELAEDRFKRMIHNIRYMQHKIANIKYIEKKKIDTLF